MQRLIHKIKIFVTGILAVGSVFLPTVFVNTVYASVPGELTGNHVRVRAYPSLDSDTNILFQVNRGQAVEILDIDGDFYRVNVRDSREVYIFREFVSEIRGQQEDTAIIEVSEAQQEDTATIVVSEAQHLEVNDSYEAILYDPEVPLATALAMLNDTELLTGNLIDDILAYAKSYIGVPYRFGSTDPSRGFDCSGFVTVVMRRFGIYLQRSSASMASTNGTYVSRSDLRPGDLVFFATGGGSRISHVGIYIGGDRFIHSASCVGVKISSMNEAYYRTRYVRANRVI